MRADEIALAHVPDACQVVDFLTKWVSEAKEEASLAYLVQPRCTRGSGRPGRQLQRGGRDVSAPRRRVGGPGRALSSGQGSELIVRGVQAGTREGDAAPEAGLVSEGYRDPD